MVLRALIPSKISGKESTDPYVRGDAVFEGLVRVKYRTGTGFLFALQLIDGKVVEGYLHPSRVLR